VERITKEDLKRRLDAHERLTLVDVRAQNAWDASDVQLPDAVRVLPNEVDQHLYEIPRDQLVVTYSADSQDESSTAAAKALLESGWTDARPLDGGFDSWKRAGYPLQAKASESPSRLEQGERHTADIRENLETAEAEEGPEEA
jgi:hydroxyacylglutathione hydrolase